jgi:hypothetical protein
MAKRSRRTRKKETQQQPASRPVPEAAPVAVPEPTPSPVVAAARKSVDFAKEYYYVYTDLRNVAIIAVIMFALMVSLGYLI